MHASPTPRGEPGRRSFACISSGIATVIQVAGGAIKGTITDLMSHSQFHCTDRVHLDLHGLIFETSICYWQDQPGKPPCRGGKENREHAGFLHTGLAPPRVRPGSAGRGLGDGAAAHRGRVRNPPLSLGGEKVWPLGRGRNRERVPFGRGRRGCEEPARRLGGWGGCVEPPRSARRPIRPTRPRPPPAVADVRFRRVF